MVFELHASGATPGKRVFNLKVVMDNGLPVTPAASMTRNLLRVADFLPFGFGFAIASMLVRRDYKRLGDIAAATLVVHEQRPAPARRHCRRAAAHAGDCADTAHAGGAHCPCAARAAAH